MKLTRAPDEMPRPHEWQRRVEEADELLAEAVTLGTAAALIEAYDVTERVYRERAQDEAMDSVYGDDLEDL